MRQPLELHGIIPPLVTPFTPDGEVDVASLRRLVRFVIDRGVHGLWVLGSFAEFWNLTERQRDEVMETAIEAANGDVPVLIGCIDTAANRSIERARRAAAAGADAIFVRTPTYLPLSQPELKGYFRTIRDAVDLPLIAYDVREITYTPLEWWAFDSATVRELAEEGTLAAIKDSTGDFAAFRELLVATAEVREFRVIQGDTLLIDASLLIGAHGAIPSLGQIAPEWCVEIYDRCRRGEWEAAREIQDRLVRLNAIAGFRPAGSTLIAPLLTGFKLALKLLGVIDTAAVAGSLTQPVPAQEDHVRRALNRVGVAPRAAAVASA